GDARAVRARRAGARGGRRGDRAALHRGRGEAGRPRQRSGGRLVGCGRQQPRRRRPRRDAAARAGVAVARRPSRLGGGRCARADDDRDGRATRDEPGRAADGPRQARLRLPDAAEERVAEGAARARQRRPGLLRLHPRRQAPGDDLDDVAHARADVRDRSLPRRRERVPHGARDAAGEEAAGSARDADAPLIAPPASARASRAAAAKLDGSARPLPARSNAVPWSGLVRTNGRPSVTLTPRSTPRYLTGMSPWSCVIATTTSNSPGCPAASRARMKTVSGA